MEPTSIPKQYGGELDWKWGDMPNLDEPAREFAGILESPSSSSSSSSSRADFVKGPTAFNAENNTIDIFGTVDGKARRKTIPIPVKNKSGSNSTAESKEKKGEDDGNTTTTTQTTNSGSLKTENENGSALTSDESGGDAKFAMEKETEVEVDLAALQIHQQRSLA